MAKKLKYVFSKTFLILATIVLSLAFQEVLFRLIPSPNPLVLNEQLTAIWVSDDELLMRPNSNLDYVITAHPEFRFRVQTNSLGWRDAEPNDQHPAQIAAIGDSVTFGFGVEGEDTYAHQLERLTGQNVINLGWMGWNPYVYPTVLKRYVIPSGAKIWLWAFFVNDLPESAAAEAFITAGKVNFKEESAENPEVGFPFNLRILQVFFTLLKPEYRLLPDSGTIRFDNGQLQMMISDYDWRMSDPTNPKVQRGWVLTEEALAQGAELAQANDAELIVVFIPSREYVYWDIIHAQVPPQFTLAELEATPQRLAEISAQHDLVFINLLAGLREAALPDRMLYFPGDGHWNAQGHEVVAQLIYEELQQQGLLLPAE